MVSLFQQWEHAGFHDNLKLPEKNELIPTNFDMMPRDDDVCSGAPTLFTHPTQKRKTKSFTLHGIERKI